MGWIPDLRKESGQLTPVTPYQTFYSSSVLRVWPKSTAAGSHESLQPINGKETPARGTGATMRLVLMKLGRDVLQYANGSDAYPRED
jgi:hypothetical protein